VRASPARGGGAGLPSPAGAGNASDTARIRILLADDHRMIVEALATRFSLVEGFEVVAALGDGAAVAQAVARTPPDVALLDVFMPPAGGIAAAAQVRQLLPSCGVVLMTAVPRPGLLARALDEGVLGVVAKSTELSLLAAAVRAAAAGQRYVDPAMETAIDGFRDYSLSCREVQVLRLAATGTSIAEIAKRVCLAEGTVRNLVSSSMKKLNARNRFDAARIAMQQGLL
jgi:two-component system response regulator DesR